MLGMQRKQLIGTDFSTYFTEPLKARQAYQHVFEHGFIRDVELEIRHGDETRPVTYNASVYYDEEKQVFIENSSETAALLLLLLNYQ